ncbi:P-loop containing nucleoside triphosphate hydrolase protein [Lophiotrema nucula]|uniref:P-loop containing nucleoside triphosphate hydrolase protein n=1 Tax=Lophiotrema nucula TaxID=690887 RepID=A0A6A5ZHT8_9PLEO|nr:P-loop containing nucleoside triphosphate hydrolase protein [Lophiotrema nucula]
MEPLDTPGIVPQHLKRRVVQGIPLVEIFQRLLYRVRPGLPGHLDDIILGGIALLIAGAPIYQFIKRQLLQWVTSEITIPENEPIAREVLQWMSANVVAKVISNSGATQAMVVSSNDLNAMDPYMSAMYGRRGMGAMAHEKTDELQALPPVGSKVFWIGMRPFLFSRASFSSGRGTRLAYSEDSEHQRNLLKVTTLGWNLAPLHAFVKNCHEYAVELKLKAGSTNVYFAGGRGGMDSGYGNWNCVVKSVRKLDTVDMDEHIKADLLKDAEEYYLPETKEFYANCGIPYRRGYLFHGPPGTGKSSFSAALAGHLNCDLYMINLASGNVTDGGLHQLFLSLPKKCIVVIEDIDAAGIGRELENKDDVPPPPTANPPAQQDAEPHQPPRHRTRRTGPNMVTLSGLLNAIDGNASQEGRLLIMTSNNPDALDEALVRPGRVDKKIHFGNLSGSAARSIFMRLIGRPAIASGLLTMPEAAQKATAFALELPPNAFTPAEIQNYLQFLRNEPDRAIAEVKDWAAKQQEKPSKGTCSSEYDSTSCVTSSVPSLLGCFY